MVIAMQHLFEKYRHSEEAPEGYWANFLGAVTDCTLLDYGAQFSGHTHLSDPIPNDGVHGCDTEYAAVLEALHDAETWGRRTFTMAKLGAAWGPWIGSAGVVARRLDFDTINLVGIEADEGRFRSMEEHFKRNGLTSDSRIRPRLYLGAAWDEKTVLKFPKVELHDYGAAASTSSHEYRGKSVEMIDIPTWTMEECLGDLGFIDLMHWDIQGAEARIAESARVFLNKRVRSLQIGTHSRPIEGRLFTLLDDMGWEIIREKPCVMHHRRDAISMENMNALDGEIYARNPALWGRSY
jgi:hypothetical protein